MKKNWWRYHHFTHVYEKLQSYEIQIAKSFVILPFFALWPSWQPKKSKFWKNEKNTCRYYHFTVVYHKWRSYDVKFLRYQPRQTEIFQKKKKTPGDIIILHMSTINKNHMMYDSWDMERNRQNFFWFGPFFHFYPFNPHPTSPSS